MDEGESCDKELVVGVLIVTSEDVKTVGFGDDTGEIFSLFSTDSLDVCSGFVFPFSVIRVHIL